MKTLTSIFAVGAGLILLAGAATAQWGGGHGAGYGGMGPGMWGAEGRGWMGRAAGCPGFSATGAGITEDKAKELAQAYVDNYLKGFTVERILPFTGMHHTMYAVEVKNEAGETRTLHIGPFGNVMPFGGPWRGRS